MKNAHSTLREAQAAFKRRRKIFFMPIAVLTLLSAAAAILLPSKYESSTTILVRRDKLLNPLLPLTVAEALTSEDRLRTFNQIIYSNPILNELYDSLYRDEKDPDEPEPDQQEIAADMMAKILTERRGGESFRISFTSGEPERAKAGAELLSNLFIKTHLEVESEYNDQVVKFYQDKMSEITAKYEETQQKVITSIAARRDALPTEGRDAYTQLERVQDQINALAAESDVYKEKLKDLKTFPEAFGTDIGYQKLYDLTRANLPFSADLRTLMTSYDELIRRYSRKYPDVVKTETRILDLLGRMKKSIEIENSSLEPRLWELERRKAGLLGKLKDAWIDQKLGQDVESDYTVYRELYDEMTVKLEQATTTRDMNKQAGNQFVIIDPAFVPQKPTKPNRPMLAMGGFGVGVLLGAIGIFLSELFDTTLRRPQDIEMYEKPIIAYIADGSAVRTK